MTAALTRVFAVSLAVLTFTFVAPAAAMAQASFETKSSKADRNGASLTVLRSSVAADGTVSFYEVTYRAGRSGATVTSVKSAAR
ncbi:hypothetical protein [Nocardiopsis ansamitocini]|uniref:Uncharacterized protein n=1 Tax=Nocardiopsis ansamitocini TaxID=1670832 RepID=A0A9W6PAD7_9ACTN|nr:hypothetical protein [Nocardiopsis ansamitocini]GLU50051.1 hypothetical protein Nans01_44020 [Nocardiopsis ansamitocini]